MWRMDCYLNCGRAKNNVANQILMNEIPNDDINNYGKLYMLRVVRYPTCNLRDPGFETI
jgi:hypothetical protein